MIPTRSPLSTPGPAPPTPFRSALVTLLAATALTAALTFVPYVSLVLYPLRLFVTFLHEGSHALAAILTGGIARQIIIQPDGSGVTETEGGWGLVIVSAGYLGAAAWGAAMLTLARRPGTARLALGLSGAVVALSALLLVRDGFGLGWGIAIAAGLLVAARRLSGRAAELGAMFLGVQCVVNALYDLKTLVGLSVPGGPISDAVLMSRIIPLPPTVWAVLWGGLALGILWAALRPFWRSTSPRPSP